MKPLAITLAVLGSAASVALAQGTSPAPQAPVAEKPCGQMLSENARYPEQLAAVVTSVADVLEAHAEWAGTGSKQAKTERDRVRKLAKQHRELAAEAQKLSAALRESRTLPEVQHDLKNVPPALTQALERNGRETRRFAQMLEEYAMQNEQRRQALMGGPAQPPQGTGGSGMRDFPADTGRPYEPPADEREPGVPPAPVDPVDPDLQGQVPGDRPDDSVPPEPPRP